jgi:tRNA modification GTPase
MLVDAMVAAGARVAEPGEFTRRAFLSGRIDLSAAEAVAEVIAAATDAELRAAQANAAGALGTLCRSWTREVAESLAEVEASIDVAEEGLQLAAPAAMAQRLNGLADRMANVARSAVSPPAAADIPRVVMTGATNVGKSSLLNALTGLDRAIVSATAGTTRVVLSAPLALGEGREILLIDLAGLTDQSHPIAAAANRAARSALAAADLVMHVLDATDPDPRIPDTVGERSDGIIVVLNKVDLLATSEIESIRSKLGARTGRVVLSCSARTGLGLATLVERLGDELHTQSAWTASPCAMHDRQRNSVLRAVTALREAARQAEPLEHLADRAEILAVDLRSAIADLGAITGDAISEEILGRIFQRFCVGK